MSGSSSSSRIIATKSYKDAILASDEVDPPAVGFAKASEGTASNLATIVKQNNLIIALLTVVAERITEKELPIVESSSAGLEEALDEITDQLRNLKLRSTGKEPVITETKGKLYVFKDPLQILKEEKEKAKR
ncbi:ORF2 protein [Cacao bacilliform Sri Lanka virus]|uniref:ORF2 protein n=1 Tax=Cacao bacilliform Sri Lanka virus TaxID=2056878 RepID=A0A2H4U9A0_9VIRU|nr:ORF2 protein [Cacao bacilliform Sri Lanka virus]ATZ69529.1 ORF2 protein [Cacao bacilliform Sri Lanka virus]